jgi:uncharacterized caspase-like protein
MARLNFCFASTLLLSAVIGTVPAFAADRVALVIGNGNYQKVPTLPNPTRDAADIGRALERLNFKVTQLSNASAAEMRKAIVDFGRSTEGSEMAVVFYAGHGMEVGGENWLIPTDAELRSDADIESEAVSLRSINLQVSKARQLGLVILDACRNNPFAAKMQRSLRTRAVARGLAPTEPMDNVLVAYAARDGTTANDGDGRNSPFTTALLRNIETPGLEISFLFRNVRDEVMSATKREQQPFVYGSLSKEAIYLKPPATASAQTSPIRTEAPTSMEDERFWQAIKPRGYATLFEQFLEKYPYSPHATEARQRLGELKSKEVVAVAPPGAGALSPAVAAPRQGEKNTIKETETTKAKPSDRNLFTVDDGQKISAVATAQRLDMPKFEISPDQGASLGTNSKFVGVWSSKRGWNGKGRYGMVIITEISATGLARGYYLWGPPVKQSWTQEAAGYKWFAEYIVNDNFSIKTKPEVAAKLDGKNVLTLSTSKIGKPSEKTSIELRPIWQLTPVRENVEPSAKRREQASRHTAPQSEAGGSSSPGNAGGSTMEDRYRACRKLVKGFARREACARTGAI